MTQCECQCNNSNLAVAAMATAMAAAMTATMVAAMGAKTAAATAMVEGTDNNQVKVAAEERTVVVATETAAATEMAMVTVTKMTPMLTIGHQQQQGGQHIQEVPGSVVR